MGGRCEAAASSCSEKGVIVGGLAGARWRATQYKGRSGDEPLGNADTVAMPRRLGSALSNFHARGMQKPAVWRPCVAVSL